jgi:hypothetical protein
MPVYKKDVDHVLQSIKSPFDWRGDLISANNLFHQGKSQYEMAVTRYGKIIETVLRELYREISWVMPPKQRTEFPKIESEIGRGKPFGKFGLGDTVRFYSDSGLFAFFNNYLGFSLFDSVRLNEINQFRIDQAHYSKEIEKEKVNQIRKDVTAILLKLGLIENDPDEIIIEQTPKGTTDKLKEKEILQQSMQRLVTKLRCGLLNEPIIDFNDQIIRDDGYSADVWAKIDIVGVYADKEEIVIIVRVIDFNTSIMGDPTPAYEKIAENAHRTIAKIAPEVKGRLRISLFDKSNDEEPENSAFSTFCF